MRIWPRYRLSSPVIATDTPGVDSPAASRIVERRLVGDPGALAALGYPLLQRIYAARGVCDMAELDYGLAGLPDYSDLAGIEVAVDVLAQAVADRRAIHVVGDFDADGATSTTLACDALSSFGARVDFFMPQRATHGYGLSPLVVSAMPAPGPGDVLLTVDNGIAAVAGVEAARAAGWQVIITDHHLPGETLPPAEAIVNPNQPGCRFVSKRLAGVGVIFYVMAALRARLAATGTTGLASLSSYLDLVAVGTVADVVALDHVNRTLVSQGLRRIRAGRGRPGINALAEAAGRDWRKLSPEDIGFVIGPRINAAGRLDDMTLGVNCLRAVESGPAQQAAEQLSSINRDRRRSQRRMVADAEAALAAMHADGISRDGIVVHGKDWHEGIVGLIASKIREQRHRPVVAFAPGAGGELKGSARSIPGVHIRDVLAAVQASQPGLITRFGGHAQAAGLTLSYSAFPAFIEAFDTAVRAVLTPELASQAFHTDGELAAHDLTLATAKRLREAGPWGAGFDAPLFHGVFHVVSQRIVGEHHLKLKLMPATGGATIDGIWFNHDTLLDEAIGHRLVYKLSVNEFRGEEKLDLVVEYGQSV